MSTQTFTPERLDFTSIRRRIDTILADFLRPLPLEQARCLGGRDDLTEVLTRYVTAPGKRIRPLLCVLGWHAAGGGSVTQPVLRTAASLELFHVFTLIHDDFMDGSDTRRGLPSAHRALASLHAERPDAEALGASSAILLGDLALIRSDQLLHRAGLTGEQFRAVLPLLDSMRDEVLLGQYIDLLGAGPPADDLDRALTVARLKTAKYTVERPLQLGAALAGADSAMLSAFSAFAVPLGEAFQLRDDLLGTFGSPSLTGKPVLEDLRSGKGTALMTLAARHASPVQRRLLEDLVGDPDLDETGAAAVCGVLETIGAREAVEDMIAERHRKALDALDDAGFPPEVTAAMREIADGLTIRSS
jgi:geranylgeranyl diphosphate synthase, type I